MLDRRFWPALLATGLALAGAPSALRAAAAAAPAPDRPSDPFFAPASFDAPSLSPNGQKICVRTRFDDRHYALTTIDVPSHHAKTLVRTAGMTVANFWWKSDDLLLLLVEDDNGVRTFQTLDLTAGKVRDLGVQMSGRTLELINRLPDDPEHMLFRSTDTGHLNNEAATEDGILEFDIRNGRRKKVEDDPGGITEWLTNREGEAIAALGYRNEQSFLLWRPSRTDEWRRITSPKGKLAEIVPMAVAPDQHRLIVSDYRGHPTARVCSYDPATGDTTEIEPAREVEPESYDTWGSAGEFAGIRYRSEGTYERFLNPQAEAASRWLATAIPGSDVTFRNFSHDNSVAIVFACNDQNPGVYCLADLAAKKLTVLSAEYPGVNPKKMAPSRGFVFTGDDGLKLAGRITLPPGRSNAPLVIANGPGLDGSTITQDFDFVAQFFASRGYAFARIAHRGASGYGRDFGAAGDFQVGTGMVRDLMAGAKWLGAQGWADVKRVAVLGEGWGGLSAFQLAAQPGAVRVLLNLNTPLDLENYTLASYYRTGDELLALAGGKKAEKDYVRGLEPMEALKNISIPSFHFYPADQASAARKIETRLKSRGIPCELMIGQTDRRIIAEKIPLWRGVSSYYEAAADFLDKNL